MRKFSEKEQKFIKLLLSQAKMAKYYLPVNLFDDIFYRQRVGFKLNRNSKTGKKLNTGAKSEFIFYRDKINNETDEILDIVNEIFERLLIIDYLKREGLITDIKMHPDSYTVNFNVGDNYSTKGKYLISSVMYEHVDDLLFECVNNPILISETLVSLVNDNFKTLEEKTLEQAESQAESARKQVIEVRKQTSNVQKIVNEARKQTESAKKQTRNSIIMVVISVISFLISAIFNYCSNQSNDELVETLDVISKSVGSIDSVVSSNIDTSLNVISKDVFASKKLLKDTLVVKVKK